MEEKRNSSFQQADASHGAEQALAFQTFFQSLDDACLILAATLPIDVHDCDQAANWRCQNVNPAFHHLVCDRLPLFGSTVCSAVELADGQDSERPAPEGPAAVGSADGPAPDGPAAVGSSPVPCPEMAALATLFGAQTFSQILNALATATTATLKLPTLNHSEWFEVRVQALATDSDTPTVAVRLRDVSREHRREIELGETQRSLAREVVALNRLHELSTAIDAQSSLQDVFDKILSTAVELAHADKGSMQAVVAADQLQLVAHHRMGKTFLDRFQFNSASFGSCGRALAEGTRVLVEDIASSPIFTGTSGLGVLMDEGITTINSTPLIGRSGDVLGILNLFYANRHEASVQELHLIDLLAGEAADAVGRTQAAEALQQSQRKALALIEELRAANQSKTEFLSILSHELRNPLASIMMSQSLLQRVPPGSSQARQTLEIMERQTSLLSRMVDDLLDATRISSNHIELRRERVELRRLVSRTVEDFHPLFADKSTQLLTDLPDHEIIVDADPARIVQVIGNLLSNAVKFTTRGDRVTVTVRTDDAASEALIRVVDSGAGINPTLIHDIFQPFVQADHSLERSRGGLGLGLAIVDGMIRLHGGTVSVASDGPGKGAVFEIRLPLPERSKQTPRPAASTADSAAGRASLDAGKSTRGTASQTGSNRTERTSGPESERADGPVPQCVQGHQPLHILVIEDNVDLADTLCSLLAILGHEAIAANNGIEGIERFFACQPQVVFCDIGLPGRNGYEVAQTLRRDSRGSGTYMIALSGYAQSDDIERALESGFNRHIAKPVSIDLLREALAAAESSSLPG